MCFNKFWVEKPTERVNPRIVGNIRRMIFAHHELFPNQTPLEVATQMQSFLIGSESTKISQREKVIDFVDGYSASNGEIIKATRSKKINRNVNYKARLCFKNGR